MITLKRIRSSDKARDALVPGIVSAGVLITVAALSFICWRRRSRTKELVNGLISMSGKSNLEERSAVFLEV